MKHRITLNLLALALGLVLSFESKGQSNQKIKALNFKGDLANFTNEKYGTHERNTFDIWLAKSNKKTPLVILIHGGGFTKGDKSKYYKSKYVTRFLDAGISVATINYRFMNQAPYGVLASLLDAKRCLQFLRYHAEKYNIDKNLIACAGGSAGAGTSLWLAFSDDMADPLNEDPVLRESTRITCAGARSTQSTYDIFRWEEIVGIPVADTPKKRQLIARIFGVKSEKKIDLKNQIEIRKELDFLGKMDKNDPPIFVFNGDEGKIPTTKNEVNHHPLHAKALKARAKQVGLEAVVYAPKIGIQDPSGKSIVDFFIEKLVK